MCERAAHSSHSGATRQIALLGLHPHADVIGSGFYAGLRCTHVIRFRTTDEEGELVQRLVKTGSMRMSTHIMHTIVALRTTNQFNVLISDERGNRAITVVSFGVFG